MEHKYNSFDQQVRDTYEGHEMPYDHSSWDALSSKLDKIAPAPTAYFTALGAGIAAVALIFLTLLFFLSGKTDAAETDQKGTSEIVENASDQSPERAQKGFESTESSEDPDVPGEKFNEKSDTSEQYVGRTAYDDTESTSPTQKAVAKISSSERPTEHTSDIGAQPLAETSAQASSASKGSTDPDEKPSGEEADSIIGNEGVIQGTESSNNKTVRTGCTGTTIRFDASKDYGKDAKYLWNFGDGFFSNEANPTHTFNKAGTFDVSLSVTSPATGQITSNVVQAMIRVLDGPRARMALYPVSPDAVKFENISSGEERVVWAVDGVETEDSHPGLLTFVPSAEQNIQLTVLGKSGCADTLRRAVQFVTSETMTFEPGTAVDFSKVSDASRGNIYIFDAETGNKTDRTDDGVWTSPSDTRNAKFIFIAVEKGPNSYTVIRGDLESRE